MLQCTHSLYVMGLGFSMGAYYTGCGVRTKTAGVVRDRRSNNCCTRAIYEKDGVLGQSVTTSPSSELSKRDAITIIWKLKIQPWTF